MPKKLNHRDIRPLRVGSLINPERLPKSWGFFFAGIIAKQSAS
jgi:hypothetical protein